MSGAIGRLGLRMGVCMAGLLALGAGGAFAELSSIPREEAWVTDGLVRTIVTTPTTTYIGGDFSYVGPNNGYGVPIDAATGTPVTVYPKVNGTVWASVPDGLGGWYIGGDFTQVGAETRNRVAHILSDGSVDNAWNPNADGTVNALTVSGSTLYVGGAFANIGGQIRNRIAALDVPTGLATAWDPNANSTVSSLAISGTVVYAGGWFTTIGGQARNRIAALDVATGLATAWNPNANSSVRTLLVSGTTVYVGGAFSTVGGQARNYIAALNSATGLATPWAPNASGGVGNGILAMVLSGTTLFVGGDFRDIGGQARFNIAAVNTSTGAATSWAPTADGYVRSLLLSGTTLYAGGAFRTIGGQSRGRVAALEAGTGAVTSWNPCSGNDVCALGVSGSTIYVGGNFSSIGGQMRSQVAALDAATGILTPWTSGNPNGSVLALAVSGNTLYVGGVFTYWGGQTRNGLVALDATTGSLSSWNPNSNSDVWALAVSGTTVYAGGNFTTIGGQTRNRIAALDPTTGLANAWNPNANGRVYALAVSGTTVYAGGTFSTIGGQTRNRIAALDATTGTATAWNPNANSTVNALAVSGAMVYAGGDFTNIGGQPRNRIAALDATTGTATAWNPNPSGGVSALAVSGAALYTGGSFTTIGGQTRNRIAGLATTTGLATTWNPNANSGVSALAVSGTTVYVGGYFATIGGQTRQGFAQFDTPPTPEPPSTPGATGIGTDTITWTWQDNSSDETGFPVYADPGAGTPTTLRATPAADATSWTHGGLSVNTQHTFQVAATNANGDSAKTAPFSAWTLALAPAAPVVGNPSMSTLDVSIGAGDGNPAGTEYALRCTTTGQWVQADGTLGASAVWQTAAAWGTVTVSGLAEYTEHTFEALARNGAGVETAAGPAASGTTLDVTPPTGTVEIDGGAAYTNNAVVALALTSGDGTGSGVADMQFSDDNALWSGWEPAGGTKDWTLPAGDGAKTVYVQFRDVSGNVSTAEISDGITLDTVPPNAVTVTSTTPSPTNGSTADFTVGFDEVVYGFDDETDLVLAATGTLAHAGVTVSPGGMNYLVQVTGITGDGELTLAVSTGSDVADGAGNGLASSVTGGPVLFDHTAPTGGLSINSGAAYTNAASVTLDPTYADGTGSGVVEMQFSDDNAAWSGWEAAAGTKAWTLPGVDGPKTVWVQYRDAAGNVSVGEISDDILLDTTPPMAAMSINSGDAHTASPNVTVEAGGMDDTSFIADARFSEDNATWSAWGPFAGVPFTLTGGDGVKTVYAQVRDGAGNVTDYDISDDILLDTAGPTGTVAINGGAANTTDPNVTLGLTSNDGTGSGVVEMQFSNDNAAWSGWEAAAGTKAWTLSAGDGVKTVYVQYRDAAGNVSTAEISDGILLDALPPTAAVTLLDPTPTQATVLNYSVTFSEAVAPTFTADDVSLTGGLAGTAAVSGADPSYTVTVTLTGTNPDGLTGIALGTDVQDALGNGFAGAVSPQYDVVWWPGFAAPVAGVQAYTGEPGPVLDASVAAGAPRVAAYQWRWDDGSKAVQDGPADAEWSLGTLLPSKDGEYWCAVTYGGLPFETNHAVVQVRDRISITAQPTDQTATPGGSATFTVAAAGGYTPLHYQWKHAGANAPGSPDAAEWTLADVMEAAAGAYTVEVFDSYNDSTASDAAMLTVGTGLPVAGLLGLAALAGALAVAGRRRRGVRR